MNSKDDREIEEVLKKVRVGWVVESSFQSSALKESPITVSEFMKIEFWLGLINAAAMWTLQVLLEMSSQSTALGCCIGTVLASKGLVSSMSPHVPDQVTLLLCNVVALGTWKITGLVSDLLSNSISTLHRWVRRV